MKTATLSWYNEFMSETDTQPDDVQDFLRPREPSHDPEYLAWRDAKIRGALAEPEKAIPQHVIWKKYGLEY
jgi:hypothetical protein